MHVAEVSALALMSKGSVTIHFIHCHNTIKKMLNQIIKDLSSSEQMPGDVSYQSCTTQSWYSFVGAGGDDPTNFLINLVVVSSTKRRKCKHVNYKCIEDRFFIKADI